KPVEPPTYNGEANFKKFEQFVSQLTEFLKACHIRKTRRVRRTQFFLRGKALDFYMTRVQMEDKKWELETFLDQLFDYCFPPGFRASQRKRLAECKQNGRTWEVWLREIRDILRVVGSFPEEQLVTYMWDNVDGYLQ
ncbi:hypothetical protein SCHPADRAFT_788108, partial [Schizopora paradoxa]